MKRYLLVAAVLSVLCVGCGKRATTIPLDTSATVDDAAKVLPQKDALEVKEAARPVFADDAEGKLLVAKLQPTEAAETPKTRGAKQTVQPPAKVEKPEPALPAQRAELKRGELAVASKPVRPYLLSTESPLAREVIEMALPQRILMQVGPLVRVPTVDVERIQPLPYLSDKPAADAAATTDPTVNFSRGLAQTTKAPARVNPAPFQRIDLPDPFRDRTIVQLKANPAEAGTPSSPDAKKP